MKLKIFMCMFFAFTLLLSANISAQTVTKHDGEYATDLTTFEYELVNNDDQDVWLNFWWGFNDTGDTIRFEIGSSVLSEDYVDVFYNSVYKIPIDIFVNNVELDVNANSTYFDYWQTTFWDRFVLPIEDGQYNNFDVLEDQDPATYDVKGDEVSYFTTESELVYDYSTGILKSWVSTITYDFTLSYIAPPVVTSEDEGGLRDRLPISTPVVLIAFITIIFVKKFSPKILNK